MRPLDKGSWPLDALGNRLVVIDYKEWRSVLIERIGYYCVYCNIPLSHNLEVEHVVPKNPPAGVQPGSLLGWDNMLLACGPCNNAKDNHPIDLNQLYFPENNNTILPFEHIEDAINNDHAVVRPSVNLTARQNSKAIATIELTKLDSIDLRKKVVDIRSIKRKDAMVMVRESFELYQLTKRNNPAELNIVASFLARVAKGYGFFGSWFRIFRDEPEMISALLDTNLIPGTALSCFDAANQYVAIPRNSANQLDPI